MQFLTRLFCCLLLGLSICVSALAANKTTFSPQQQKEIEGIVYSYLMHNPQILLDVAHKLNDKAAAEEDAKVAKIKKNINKYKQVVFAKQGAGRVMIGNPNGKIIMVEFFQYPCSHCKMVAPEVEKLLHDNSDLTVIYVYWTFFKDAALSAKAGLAAQKQDKFLPVHQALMASTDFPSQDNIDKILHGIAGLDFKKITKDMQSGSLDKGLGDNFKLAQKLELLGTPTFIFANSDLSKVSLVAGQTPNIANDLKQALKEVR